MKIDTYRTWSRMLVRNRRTLTEMISPTGFAQRLQSTQAGVEYEKAKPFEEIPSPKGVPVLKNLLDITSTKNRREFTQFHKSLVKKLGQTYRIRMPGKNNDLLFINRPDDTRTLLSLDGQMPIIQGFEPIERLRQGPLKDEYKIPGLMSQGEEWLEFRRAVQQDMMRPDSALYYIDDMSEVMDQVIERLESKKSQDNVVEGITRVMQEFALESVGVMFIGTKLGLLQGSEEGKKLIATVEKIMEYTIYAIAIPNFILKHMPSYKAYIEDNRTMFKISKKHIQNAIDKHEQDGSLEGTIVGRLVERCGKDSNVPVVMALDAMFAGIDTTGNTSAFLLYHLASNPDKQEKLYKEILQIVGKDGKMTKNKLTEMRYLKACQMESQRMLPVILGLGRKTKVDMVLDGYQVPKGTFVIRHGTIIKDDESYFNDAEHFIPERWIRGSPEFKKIDAHAFLPFSHGPRSCVGQRFARIELYMLVFKIIQKYKLEYDGPPITVDYTAVGKPDKPLNLIMKRR